jgi:hypothetical protein
MRLICPSCGAIASAEAWENDAAARQALDVVTRLPGVVQSRVLPYLGLFRQGGRGLTWTRALRLLQQLQDMVESGTVRWEGGELRPCPPTVWAAALDAVLARRPKGLKNHNYLRHVAWEMAAGRAASEERAVERQRMGRAYVAEEERAGKEEERVERKEERVAEGTAEPERPATEEERRKVYEMLKAWTGKMGGARP